MAPERLPRAWSYAAFTAAGGHAVNEDAFLADRHPADANAWLCVLADGMGGQPNGGPAAWTACRAAMAEAQRTPPRALSVPRTWEYLLRGADQAVAGDAAAGFCTLIGFLLWDGKLAGASCGDSAAR